MQRPGRWSLTITACALWLVAVSGYVFTLVVRVRLDSSGQPELEIAATEAVVYGAALFSAATVGWVVAVRRPHHPIGWLFLALGVALAIGAAGDAFALDRGVRGGEVGSTTVGLALVAGQASFIAWFALVAAVLQLTPSGRPISRRWGWVLRVTGVTAVIALLAKTVQDTEFEAPFAGLHNPWALHSLSALVDVIAGVTITLVSLGLVASALALVLRFRRADAQERRQLRWMAMIAVALPLLVAASAAAALTGADIVRTVATGGFVASLPIAAGLSVQQYRLYDVDRILSRAVAYVLSSVIIGVLYVAVVAFVGQTVGRVVDGAVLPAVMATVAAVSAAAPLHRRVQDLVDRRFDRRRYDARRLIADHLRAPTPGRSIDATLAMALADPTLTVAYWIDTCNEWVSASGQQITTSPDDIEVSRDGEPVARVHIDPNAADVPLAVELAGAAIKELDTVRLRAAVAVQLEDVRDSRARLVSAQTDERRRLERNLHDGAQQRLLALAMQLRSAQLRSPVGTDDADILDRAVAEISASVRELRDLANGLHPAVLSVGGLPAALDELAGRVPLPVTLQLAAARCAPMLEETLWFVACEAVANAVKHASANRLTLTLVLEGTDIRLTCSDDGNGLADSRGSGLQGLADRVEAVGGRLVVRGVPGHGSTVEAVVLCGS